MSNETAHARLSRLIGQAVKSGQFKNQTQILRAAGLSSGYMGELAQRCAANPQATIQADTAVSLAQALGVSLYDITGEKERPADDDEDPERGWAVSSARIMRLPEAAIQVVLRESPGAGDRWYWWLRIETVARQIGGPAPGRFGKPG